MGKHLKIYMGLIIAVCLLSACGQAKLPDVVERDSIVIDKDGSITSYIIGDFDKDYYELSELTVMAREETSEYNKQNGADFVIARDVELMEDGSPRARAIYDYASYIHYSGFNEENLYYGTVQEAVSEDSAADTFFSPSLDFSSVKNVKDGSAADREKLSNKHIVITDADALIYCPEPVAYISEGAVLNEDGSVDTAQADGIVIIIMKK